tara:strand:- start:390 stop:671 length:282 start_codon:yes stop_codon:yes gene_type:complete
MTKLVTEENKLMIEMTDGTKREVLRGWESYSGWYWFATKMERRDYGGAPLWYGFVQGMYDEWGTFSQVELDSLGWKVWEINEVDLPHAGRREQ